MAASAFVISAAPVPATDLPCDGDGECMVCKSKPSEAEILICVLCATPWHATHLSSALPPTFESTITWECPDCTIPATGVGCPPVAVVSGVESDLIVSIKAIEADATLTDKEKAKRRQMLLGGCDGDEDGEGENGDKGNISNDVLQLLDASFHCSFCMHLPERPVTTPCGHNFCLKCFQKWIGQRKNTCAKCRSPIPSKMALNPRINSALVAAIRMAKVAKNLSSVETTQVYHSMRNDDRPDKAFTTERAKRAGKANACSGQIFVTIPPDFFGPITAEYDPKRNHGVIVGEMWEDRMECRQWGAHFPHVAGIAGQSNYGAQSVALSGGYQDDEDHGEWFLYTGSGGRDLSGNKRTNKDQSFDQNFEKLNGALKMSCLNGYPVRVVRSHKEKRSSYAPESGVRYDGVYRIEKCWRKVGIQGFKVCRYLFIRCDNEPAPWTSDERGDCPRPLPRIKELADASDFIERKQTPSWDHDQTTGWKWMKPPPASKKPVVAQHLDSTVQVRRVIKRAQNISITEKLLKGFCCLICKKVMQSPLTTPCAHNFCKACLLGSYANLSFSLERNRGGRTLRSKKVVNNCPKCPTEISEFLQNPQVNREMMDLIESLQKKSQEADAVDNDSAAADCLPAAPAKKQKINEAGDDVEAAASVKGKKEGAIDGDSEISSANSEQCDSV